MDWVTSIKEIQKAQENNQLVVFVGAGVSANSGVPSWWELIKRFAEKIAYNKCDTCNNKSKNCPLDDCHERYNFTQDEFLRIPEYYYQQNKSDDNASYYGLIQETLRGGSGPNLIDDEIFNLLPHHVITTNYDSLLEDSTALNSQLYTVVSQDSDLLSKASERYIIKMHGDLELPNTIVLKESDYIDYEQIHPLISTFIRSLLVNHTFVFLGYSLNDYNLNLIIGWINYFQKFYRIEERPANFLIASEPANSFEKSRLEDKNIYVVATNTLPDEIVNKANIPNSFNDPIGRRLLAYLRCVTDSKIIQDYIPLEERLMEKYQLLKPYTKISYQDLIAVHPLGRTKFLDTQLVFFEKDWFENISKILTNEDSPVVEVFKRAGISAIHFWDDDSQKEVSGALETVDNVFQLYLDNDYIKLEDELTNSDDSVQKLFYYHLLGRNQTELELFLEENVGVLPELNYVSIILQKMRVRMALISFWDRQENKTYELKKLFETTISKDNKAIGFLKMLFDSMTQNIYKMERLLEKHEKRYEYSSNTIYFGNAFMDLWELKSYAYDYYFFFVKNGLPLHYFSETKEYLSYYVRALLCTYSPIKSNYNDMEIPITRKQNIYVLGEIELDMIVKYTTTKSLQAWIKKYSVQKLEIEEDINVVNKFVNICNAFSKFKNKYWLEQIKNYSIVLCLLDIEEEHKKTIIDVICNVMEEVVLFAAEDNIEFFEVLVHIIGHFDFSNTQKEFEKLVDIITRDEIYSVAISRYALKYSNILKKCSKYVNSRVQKKLEMECNMIEPEEERCNRFYNLRSVLSKEVCVAYFNDHIDILNTEQIFYLLIEDYIKYKEEFWQRFVEEVKQMKEGKYKIPGMQSLPNHNAYKIEKCILLKLFGYPVKLDMLLPYVGDSDYLQFIINPDEFDYSKVETSNYMWQNLIYSKDYRRYFVEHRDEILTEQLRNLFKLGVQTDDQQKIVYGILLDEKELQGY